MYNPKSNKAEEFISHQEVLDTLDFAQKNKSNIELIDKILEKARKGKGLSHREAAVLLDCDIEEKNKEIFALAKKIKQDYYGNRIVLFAPLYLSNYCINGCVYCPYHAKNTHIPRKKMTQDEIREEVIALQDMGHKRLAIETGEDPVNNPIEYVLESLKTIYSIHHKNGAIRRANVNIAATTVENYRKLKEAGIGTYILFQETYNKETYEKLHPSGPKHNYKYHTEAMDRAMQGGIDDVGLGVLFGLELYRYEFSALLMHAEHLEAVFGVGPHTISVPRIRRADDIDPSQFDNGIDDDTFAKICALIRISVPYTGMIISTRESQAVREKVLPLGVSQISGASRTSVGGYAEPETEEDVNYVYYWTIGNTFVRFAMPKDTYDRMGLDDIQNLINNITRFYDMNNQNDFEYKKNITSRVYKMFSDLEKDKSFKYEHFKKKEISFVKKILRGQYYLTTLKYLRRNIVRLRFNSREKYLKLFGKVVIGDENA